MRYAEECKHVESDKNLLSWPFTFTPVSIFSLIAALSPCSALSPALPPYLYTLSKCIPQQKLDSEADFRTASSTLTKMLLLSNEPQAFATQLGKRIRRTLRES
jgi:hypothetical protein